MKQIFLKSIIAAIGFFGTLFLGIVVYAAWTNISTKIDGQVINADSWNEIVNNINTIGQTYAPAGMIAAFNLSSCPTGRIAANGSNGTPDLRGEFIRGLDSGRGVDSGRTLASAQKGSLLGANVGTDNGHSVGFHWYSSTYNDVDHDNARSILGYDWGTISNYNDVGNKVYTTWNGTTNNGGLLVQGNMKNGDGAKDFALGQSRPRNVALLYCVKQ